MAKRKKLPPSSGSIGTGVKVDGRGGSPPPGDEETFGRMVSERKRMQEELAATEARLRKTREDLERKVQERTADLSEANARLRESEEKFRRITENMRDVVCQLDDTGRICYASPSYLQVLGYHPADLMGQSSIARVHPDDVGPVLAAFQASLESGKPVDVLLRYRHATGHFVWLHSRGSFLFDEKGRMTGAVVCSRDITQHKMAEQALEESEARFRSLAESTNDWIWETDAEGRYTYVSPNVERLLGYKPKEFLGRRPFQFMPQEEAKQLSILLRVVKDAGKPYSGVEKVHVHKDGHRVVFEGCGIPILSPDAGLLGYRGIDRDISQRKALEAQAIRVRHLSSIGELAAGVAHEINNPVTGIINYAQILQDEAAESGQEAEIPGRIIKEGERIARIVKNLLSFAREGNTDKEPIPVLAALEDSIALMATLFRKEGIAVKVEDPDRLPMIVANRKDLQQVFMNLLANSRYALNAKYKGFHEEKRIQIGMEQKASEEASWVRMTFFDSGVGIPPEVLGRIFDPFFTTKPSNQAVGLGLSISYGILKDHRGNIDVESREGEYTKVMLEFPASGSQVSERPLQSRHSTRR